MHDAVFWQECGRLLKSERERARWSQREVARRAKLHGKTVSEHEAGQIRGTAALTAHLSVFNWRVIDVGLLIAAEHPIVQSSDVLALVTAYYESSADARAALSAIARVLAASL